MSRCFRRLCRGDRGRFLLVEREAKVRWLVCAVRSCAGACGETGVDIRGYRDVRMAGKQCVGGWLTTMRGCGQRQRWCRPPWVHRCTAVEVWKPPLMCCGVQRRLRSVRSRARSTQVGHQATFARIGTWTFRRRIRPASGHSARGHTLLHRRLRSFVVSGEVYFHGSSDRG